MKLSTIKPAIALCGSLLMCSLFAMVKPECHSIALLEVKTEVISFEEIKLTDKTDLNVIQ